MSQRAMKIDKGALARKFGASCVRGFGEEGRV